MYLGIDLGTSAVKAVLVDDAQSIVDQETATLEVSRPRPLWSEQDPEQWWASTCAAVHGLRSRRPRELSAVRGIGLSGQMHGATLLDDAARVLRPAILWNDGRSAAQCAELERRVPRARRITGNMAMPGFTAPKLLWVAQHEPDIFARVRKVLLPKDYVRLRMTGEYASEMSDAAGTLWLDVARRTWSSEMVEACDLPMSAMPSLHEGSAPTGVLQRGVADDWGMSADVVVAGGGGDNAAGAAGVGVTEPGQAFLSLGTSGVYFVAGDAPAPNPDRGVHAFCHCLPGRWHQMSVILSAASCLSWLARVTAADDETELLTEAEAARRDPGALVFLPYLSGERTPHNDANAKGVFFGMTHATTRADLTRAVLEGVAFALADGQAALLEGGQDDKIDQVFVIGGGARSQFWGGILASILDRPLTYAAAADVGPAVGAARLARLAVTGEDPTDVCAPPPATHVVDPDPEVRDRCSARYRRYQALYPALREAFATSD
jgi:xylulokinase